MIYQTAAQDHLGEDHNQSTAMILLIIDLINLNLLLHH